MLLYKLDVESLVLAAGRTRWLGTATHEVELVIEHVQQAELLRAIEVDELAAELGLEPAPTLAALIDALEEPWRDVFVQHRQALVAIAAEIEGAVRTNKQLLKSGQRAVHEALRIVTNASGLYRPDGTVASVGGHIRMVDEAM